MYSYLNRRDGKPAEHRKDTMIMSITTVRIIGPASVYTVPLTGVEGLIAECARCSSFIIEAQGMWHHMNDRCQACFGTGYTSPDPDCTLGTLHGEHNEFLQGLAWGPCSAPTPKLCGDNPLCLRPVDVEHPCPRDHRDCCGICCAVD